jgi:serine/threonine-protein kinase HipA
MEDFCVLNALRSNGRYHGSYEQVAKRIREFVSAEQASPALEQFFLTVALCCAIENGDAHLKNFAVVYENTEGVVRMAPAYDLVCTTLYLSRDSMALTLEGSKAFPQLKELTAFGIRHCDVPGAKVKRLLQRVTEGVKQAAGDVRAYIKQHPDFSSAGERLIGRFEHGLQRLQPA